MNKLTKVLASAALTAGMLSGAAHAVNFASVNLAVTVTSAIDISIVGSNSITFPPVGLGDSTGVVGNNNVTIKNDSSGLSVALLLAGNDDANWQCGGATTTVTVPGTDQFALRAVFNGATAPTAAGFTAANDYIASQTFPRKTATQLPYPGGFRRSSTAGGNGVFEGTESGAGLIPAATRGLWVQFIPASGSSVLFGSRTLVLSIVAEL